MSLRPSPRVRARIVDRYTPPAHVDDAVRESRVPDCGCARCGYVGRRREIGRACACGGILDRLPASAWRWCQVCSGRGACCDSCGWHGVVLRRAAESD